MKLVSLNRTLSGIFTGKKMTESSQVSIPNSMHTLPDVPFSPTIMNDTTYQLNVTKSLKLLTNGFKSDFASHVFADMRMNELLVELATEFVDVNVPIIDEDNQVELALMLVESLDLVAR